MTAAQHDQMEAELERARARLKQPDICDLEEHHLRRKVRRLQTELERYDCEAVRDILLLVSRRAPMKMLLRWSPKQRKTASDWAVHEHLHAGDNLVSRLPIPPHVAELAEVRP